MKLKTLKIISYVYSVLHAILTTYCFIGLLGIAMSSRGNLDSGMLNNFLYLLMFPFGYLAILFDYDLTPTAIIFLLNSICWIWLFRFLISRFCDIQKD